MNEQYDLYLLNKLGETVQTHIVDPNEADKVTCVYVDSIEYVVLGTLSNNLTAKRVMASTAQLIPTITNIT